MHSKDNTAFFGLEILEVNDSGREIVYQIINYLLMIFTTVLHYGWQEHVNLGGIDGYILLLNELLVYIVYIKN